MEHVAIDEMLKDLDKHFEHSNQKHTYQGRNMNGRTPRKEFIGGISKQNKGAEEHAKKGA